MSKKYHFYRNESYDDDDYEDYRRNKKTFRPKDKKYDKRFEQDREDDWWDDQDNYKWKNPAWAGFLKRQSKLNYGKIKSACPLAIAGCVDQL